MCIRAGREQERQVEGVGREEEGERGRWRRERGEDRGREWRGREREREKLCQFAQTAILEYHRLRG